MTMAHPQCGEFPAPADLRSLFDGPLSAAETNWPAEADGCE